MAQNGHQNTMACCPSFTTQLHTFQRHYCPFQNISARKFELYGKFKNPSAPPPLSSPPPAPPPPSSLSFLLPSSIINRVSFRICKKTALLEKSVRHKHIIAPPSLSFIIPQNQILPLIMIELFICKLFPEICVPVIMRNINVSIWWGREYRPDSSSSSKFYHDYILSCASVNAFI